MKNRPSWGNVIHIYRHPKTLNEKKQNATVEHRQYVRAKRKPANLPDSWFDLIVCRDNDTKRQKRISQNNFRKSIKFIIPEE